MDAMDAKNADIIQWLVCNITAKEVVISITLLLACCYVLVKYKMIHVRIGRGETGNGQGLSFRRNYRFMADETRRHLYFDDGTTKYVTRKECSEDRDVCTTHTHNEIASLCKEVQATRNELSSFKQEVNRSLGRIEGALGIIK